MEFDLDNYEKYLTKTVSPESLAKIAKLDSMINVSFLNSREVDFVESVRKRIRAERSITDKQRAWLARILKKCNP